MNYDNIQSKLFLKQLNKDGIEVTVNGVSFKGIVREIDEKDRQKDCKYFFTMTPINLGDVIKVNSKSFIVIKELRPNLSLSYHQYIVLESSLYVKFINDKAIIWTLDGYMENNNITLSEGRYLNIEESKYTLTIPYFAEIKEDMRFIKWGRAFKIKGIDFTRNGLMDLKVEKDQTSSQNDDLIEEVADRWKYQKKYDYVITCNDMSIFTGKTKKLDVVVTNKGVIIEKPSLIYTSNDTNIGTVDNNGVVNALKKGSVIITLEFQGEDNKTYKTNANITVKNEFEYVINSDANIEIQEGNKKNITTIVTNNGVIVENPTLIYSSNNNTIATISTGGEITAIVEGDTTITVSYSGLDGKTYTSTTILKVTKAPVIHHYNIVSEVAINLNEGEKHIINTVVTDNGVNLLNPVLTYVSDSDNIATVGANGEVTAIKEGTCNIQVAYTGEDNVKYTSLTNVVVKALPVSNITYVFDIPTYGTDKQANEIHRYDTKTVRLNKYDNGVLMPNGEFTITLENPNNLDETKITLSYSKKDTSKNYIKVQQTLNMPSKDFTLKFVENSTGLEFRQIIIPVK